MIRRNFSTSLFHLFVSLFLQRNSQFRCAGNFSVRLWSCSRIKPRNRIAGSKYVKFPVFSQLSGNLTDETGSMGAASTTTQSCATGDFLKVYERPRIGGDLCDGSFSETTSLQSAGRFCAFFSGPEIPFPGNGDRERQRLGSNAGYSEGSPSIWCCRDHSADMSARRATPIP